MHELRGAPELGLEAALERVGSADLVLVEGFKKAPIPKLEVYRRSVGKPMLHPGDPNVVGVATDEPLVASLPVLPLGDADVIATFIARQVTLGVRDVDLGRSGR
jgi:molybdopterin-guanine dinucleotide biosynthesis protein B